MTSKLTLGKKAKIGLAAALTIAGTAVIIPATVGTANAAATVVKLSPATGPADVATAVVSITGKGFQDAAGADQVSSVAGDDEIQFSAVACPTTWAAATGIQSVAVDVVSATRIIATAPSIAINAGLASGPIYNVCIYSNATVPVLLGTGTYTVHTPPTITANLSPASGLPAGGTRVTITGTGFTPKATAKLGGVAMKNVTYVNATTLTATVPAGAVGTQDLVVTTLGGASTASTGTWNDFTYVNAITVTPKTNTGANGQKVIIKGSGFSGLDFATPAPATGVTTALLPDPTKAAVLFTVGGWAGAASYDTAPFACTKVTVASDTELVCTTGTDIDLVSTAYSVVVALTSAGTTTQSVVSSTATYTVSPF